MAQELGRIERPALERFAGKRKLLLVPLVFQSPTQPQEGQAALERYWSQVRSQVASLESKLGSVRHLFHEGVTVGGTEGLERLRTAGGQSYSFVAESTRGGETLEATESEDLLAETLDLQRCLSLPLGSEKVASQLQAWLNESSRGRYEHIARRIDETIGEDEVAVLLIGERHQVQFPGDMEVIYVSPPALEEYRRWLREWVAQLQQAASEQVRSESGEGEPEREQ